MAPTIFWIKVQIVSMLFAPLGVVGIAALLNWFLTLLAKRRRENPKRRAAGAAGTTGISCFVRRLSSQAQQR
jgi:hypothetical protein